jgi:hypothetical protein
MLTVLADAPDALVGADGDAHRTLQRQLCWQMRVSPQSFAMARSCGGHLLLRRSWWQMLVPRQSLQLLLMRLSRQILAPQQSLQMLLRRLSGQMPAPPHCVPLRRLCWQIPSPRSPCRCVPLAVMLAPAAAPLRQAQRPQRPSLAGWTSTKRCYARPALVVTPAMTTGRDKWKNVIYDGLGTCSLPSVPPRRDALFPFASRR